MDLALDGFGHHNPELTQPDDLWRDAMAIDWMIEGLFRRRDLSANEAPLAICDSAPIQTVQILSPPCTKILEKPGICDDVKET